MRSTKTQLKRPLWEWLFLLAILAGGALSFALWVAVDQHPEEMKAVRNAQDLIAGWSAPWIVLFMVLGVVDQTPVVRMLTGLARALDASKQRANDWLGWLRGTFAVAAGFSAGYFLTQSIFEHFPGFEQGEYEPSDWWFWSGFGVAIGVLLAIGVYDHRTAQDDGPPDLTTDPRQMSAT